MPRASAKKSPAVKCHECGKVISRKADLPRHMRLHADNIDEMMYTCPYDGCGYKNLQKSNVTTHYRTHTGEKPFECPDRGCDFTTSDPGSLTRHRKSFHDYEPKPCNRVTKRGAGRKPVRPAPYRVQRDSSSESGYSSGSGSSSSSSFTVSSASTSSSSRSSSSYFASPTTAFDISARSFDDSFGDLSVDLSPFSHPWYKGEAGAMSFPTTSEDPTKMNDADFSLFNIPNSPDPALLFPAHGVGAPVESANLTEDWMCGASGDYALAPYSNIGFSENDYLLPPPSTHIPSPADITAQCEPNWSQLAMAAPMEQPKLVYPSEDLWGMQQPPTLDFGNFEQLFPVSDSLSHDLSVDGSYLAELAPMAPQPDLPSDWVPFLAASGFTSSPY